MRFKKGDRVLVQKNLNMRKTYYMRDGLIRHHGDGATIEMKRFEGQVVTIRSAFEGGYRIEEDGDNWNWTDDMFVLSDNLITMERIDAIKGEEEHLAIMNHIEEVMRELFLDKKL